MPAPLAPSAALELVLERVQARPAEPVPVAVALGRTLADDLHSAIDVPGFDNSAMDGFAVRAAETGPDARLTISDEARAGRPAMTAVSEGQAARISTGAMLPAGADAVIRIEDVTERDSTIECEVAVEPGRDIRRAGDDLRAGERVLTAGTVLGPPELAVAAAVGTAELTCSRPPTVAALATGDELAEPGTPLGPGQIHNSNAVAITSLARRAGAGSTPPAHAGDDFEATVRAIEAGLRADILVITGGVSVGPHDHVKPALAELGVEEVFWGVALRPGKPTWFGVAPQGTLVFGLPGNPVSAMITFHLFVAPAIARALGRRAAVGPRTRAVFDADYRKQPGRMHVVRCRMEADAAGLRVRPTKQQGSHVLTSMLDVDALAYLEVERGDVTAGETVEVELLKQ